jgi:hypothetical protein
MQELIAYINNWLSSEDKPQNESRFIDFFIKTLQADNGEIDICFDGESEAGGKQVTIELPQTNDWVLPISIVYNNKKIAIYESSSDLWVKEFVLLNKGNDRFEELHIAWNEYLIKSFGIDISKLILSHINHH